MNVDRGTVIIGGLGGTIRVDLNLKCTALTVADIRDTLRPLFGDLVDEIVRDAEIAIAEDKAYVTHLVEHPT